MKDKILDILEEICGTDEVKENLDINLFEEGLMDSLGMIELFIEFEEKLGIKVQLTTVEKDEISTPQKIIEFISQRG